MQNTRHRTVGANTTTTTPTTIGPSPLGRNSAKAGGFRHGAHGIRRGGGAGGGGTGINRHGAPLSESHRIMMENDFVSADEDNYRPSFNNMGVPSQLYNRLGLGPSSGKNGSRGGMMEPAVITLAGDVRVRSKLISWNTFSISWILFLLLFIVGNGGLAVITGLDTTGVGPGLPLLDIIWHFALFVAFGVLLIYLIVQVGNETLVTDRVRLPLIVANAMLFNLVMTFVFLTWVLDNTSQHAQVDYSDNMKAYSSFVTISGISFLWFFVVVAVSLLTWLIHYNQRKTLELIDLVLSVEDQHLINLHETSLKTLVTELRQAQPPGSFIPKNNLM